MSPFHFVTVSVSMLSLLTLLACGKLQAEEAAETSPLPDVAMVAEMYGHYIDGDFMAFVDQMESLDHATEDYRAQMANLFKQRHHAQVEENGGPVACRLMNVIANANKTYAEVYVEVTFGDGSYEEIMLPMVRVNDMWRLR